MKLINLITRTSAFALLSLCLVAAPSAAIAQAPQSQTVQPSQAQSPENSHAQAARQPSNGGGSVFFRVTSASEQLKITVDSSRIITLRKRIPQAQVNNPEILELTALSPTQVQVFARKVGVTQVNLWDEDGNVYTVDVTVVGNSRELAMLLKSQFPNASIEVVPVSSGVLLSGYVDQPEQTKQIMEIAEEYYPKVISNLSVGGVHKVLLHVKVMEVSRTKLRELGFDWATVSKNGSTVLSAPTGILQDAASAATTGGETFAFTVVDDGVNAFIGVLDALRQDNLLRVLSEPTLVTVSGERAFFQVGGEFPIMVPQSLGTVSIEYRKFGTQVEFVPIVLGNGKINLEVWPRVSEIDNSQSVTLNDTTVPGLKVREVKTMVEMEAGQTLAIAGLVQTRTEAERRGLPLVSDLPYVGAAFRKVMERQNEIELLVLVTPELVGAMEPEEVPACGPGTQTASPNDHELYLRGHIEVPRCCPPGSPSIPHPAVGADGRMLDLSPRGITVQTSNDSGDSSPPGMLRSAPSTAGKQNPQNRQASTRGTSHQQLPGFIGPVGYDGQE